ncbi:MAG: amidohydrolase, partial [Flavobacteriaceae bacterium]|nr:amidohydrolase [Flavobacteriaceae bacterium]
MRKLFNCSPKVFLLLALVAFRSVMAQEYFPKNDGVSDKNTNYYAFKNATIHIAPAEVISKGTLLIREGKIVDVGTNVSIPKNTVIIDLKGKEIYASFIDVYSDFGIEIPKTQQRNFRQQPQYDATRQGYYWNDHIRPETNAVDHFKYDDKKAEELLKVGFGTVNTHYQDGIIRGTSMLVTLNNGGTDADRILDDRAAQVFSFRKSSASAQAYPTSLMGAIALLKQFYYDADWYAKGHVDTKDISIEAFNRNRNLPQLFFANDKQNDLRADMIGDLFGVQYTIVGKGNEYQLADQIKATNAMYILPLNFPKAYNVENPFQADYVSLEDMRYWNQAPANPKVMADKNIPFALTTHELKSAKEFQTNLYKAIEYGLDKKVALEALTTIPAKILNKSNEVGTLRKGLLANFIITSGDIFDKKTILYENWVQGKKYLINDMNTKDLSGDYTLTIGQTSYSLKITGEPDKPKAEIKKDTVKVNAIISYKDGWLSLLLIDKDDVKQLKAVVQPEGNVVAGTAVLTDGSTQKFKAIKKDAGEKTGERKKDDSDKPHPIVPASYPNDGYGFSEKPELKTLLIKNATVWTGEQDGILKNTDVLLKNGKIAKIGQNLSDKDATVIDASGKYLTAGIIDEHTHIATASVNEAGQNSSAEVSIADNLDSETINIYRNLAGGVTSMQILHGSANPIGGQSAIVKLKWGETGDKMLYTNSPKFIKFALGENVKQSNWGNTERIRFPQTRMGVEQVYMDYFTRAKEYDSIKKTGKPYRKDLEMETLA